MTARLEQGGEAEASWLFISKCWMKLYHRLRKPTKTLGVWGKMRQKYAQNPVA